MGWIPGRRGCQGGGRRRSIAGARSPSVSLDVDRDPVAASARLWARHPALIAQVGGSSSSLAGWLAACPCFCTLSTLCLLSLLCVCVCVCVCVYALRMCVRARVYVPAHSRCLSAVGRHDRDGAVRVEGTAAPATGPAVARSAASSVARWAMAGRSARSRLLVRDESQSTDEGPRRRRDPDPGLRLLPSPRAQGRSRRHARWHWDRRSSSSAPGRVGRRGTRLWYSLGLQQPSRRIANASRRS